MRLVHSFSPFEEICFLLDDGGRPLEISVWRENDLQTDAVYLAQAVRFVGSGWFLDIGNGRSAYMNTPSAYMKPDGTVCSDKLTQGDRLIVRIVRPETSEKEAEASGKVSLSGRTVVWMPMRNTPSFSKKLPPSEWDRLKLLAPNEGVLFRTAAQNQESDVIASEIAGLKKVWQSLTAKADRPALLFRPCKDVFRYAERYKEALTEIVTDDSSTAAELKKDASPVTFHPQGVWEKEALDEALDEGLAVRAPLPSGGFLMTQQTSACVCFDVNAGSGRIGEANEEACLEILRQIRLKGLGGQMIIDFAGRKDEKIIRRLIHKLKNENIFISGISTLGLVELTVEKTRASLFDLFPDKNSAVRNAASVFRRLWFASCTGKNVDVFAPMPVLSLIRLHKNALESRLNSVVNLSVSETLRLEGIKE